MLKINQTIIDIHISYIRTKYKNIIQEYKLECTPDDSIQLILIKIKNSQRHKGYGSAVMYELCKLADYYNVSIVVSSISESHPDLKALYTFFNKHGFVLIKNDTINELLYYPVIFKP